MLQELLQTEMQKLTGIIENKDDYIKSKAELEEKIAGLKNELDSIDMQLDENLKQIRSLNKERSEHTIRSFIRSRGIKKQLELIGKLDVELGKLRGEKLSEYEREKTVVDAKIEEYQEQIENIEEAEHELELMKSDQNYAIERLIKENPELLENEEFVLDLIDISMEYIALDKTNSERVYSKFLSKVCEVLEERKRQPEIDNMEQKDIQDYIEHINYCLEELKNPKLVSDGKYKIPHEFLFEGIRRKVLSQSDRISMEKRVSACCNRYKRFDGKCDYTSGKKLEELYMDENTDLYLHVVWGQKSEFSSIVNTIYRDGLILKSVYNDRMDRTTVSQNQLSGYFFQFLESAINAHEMILCIPKNESMILGNNDSENDKKYILPEYVIGEITQNEDGEIVFIQNPIPISERAVYEYKYFAIKTNEMEGKISPVTAVKNALSQGTTLEETVQAASMDAELSVDKSDDTREE